MDLAIKKYVSLSMRHPRLAWVFTLSIIRALKSTGVTESDFTLARSGISPASNVDIAARSPDTPNRHVLLKTVEDQLDLEASIVLVFNRASGSEIDVLNILYANRMVGRSNVAWVLFFNRYLKLRNGWEIGLRNENSEFVFERLRSVAPLPSIEGKSKVSVIMPVYNNEATVGYAARSILDQDYRNIELIIVDDCSTDRTATVCAELASSDVRVRVVTSATNCGAYVSRNRGLRIATGKYITVLDGDDWAFPQRIGYQVRRLEESTQTCAHLGYYLRIDETGRINSFRKCGEFSFDGVLHKCLASMMIDVDLLRSEFGFWDSVRFGADAELYYRIVTRKGPGSILEDPVPLVLALDRYDSLTTAQETRLGSELRMRYASAFGEWHSSVGANPYISFPQRERPFAAPPEMLVNSTTGYNPPRISIFGTSRLHRVFCKRMPDGSVFNNIHPDIDLVFPRLGYFHTAGEVLQILRWLKDPSCIPSEYWRYVFRIEPRPTTPFNEFDQTLEASIRNGSQYITSAPVFDVSCVVVEISSLTENVHLASGLLFHSNPNVEYDIPYSRLGPSGFFGAIGLGDQVERRKVDFSRLVAQLSCIRDQLRGIEVIVMGHLRSGMYPHAIRDASNETIKRACESVGFRYFENEEFLDAFGWNAGKDGTVDRHHLSHEGEMALGASLQKHILSLVGGGAVTVDA